MWHRKKYVKWKHIWGHKETNFVLSYAIHILCSENPPTADLQKRSAEMKLLSSSMKTLITMTNAFLL